MESASNKFKLILGNMEREQLLNFIWCYDQYVKDIDKERDEEEDYNMSPVNIEDFHRLMYKGKMELK